VVPVPRGAPKVCGEAAGRPGAKCLAGRATSSSQSSRERGDRCPRPAARMRWGSPPGPSPRSTTSPAISGKPLSARSNVQFRCRLHLIRVRRSPGRRASDWSRAQGARMAEGFGCSRGGTPITLVEAGRQSPRTAYSVRGERPRRNHLLTSGRSPCPANTPWKPFPRAVPLAPPPPSGTRRWHRIAESALD
jgi:hypothetical protein